MKISLVMGTINRVDEVHRFINSAANQIPDLQLVVVDQNADDRLVAVLNKYRGSLEIVHLRSTPGLSKARNVGLGAITGEIVAFPDDDCWYPDGLLGEICQYFGDNAGVDGICLRALDQYGHDVGGKWEREAGLVTKRKVWNQGISYTIFLRRRVVDGVGGFNEKLGVGSGTVWGSGEETDYLLRALRLGYSLMYLPHLAVNHPAISPEDRPRDARRVFGYARGMGRVMKMHGYSMAEILRLSLISFAGALFSAIRGDPASFTIRFRRGAGRLRGWFDGG